jgi:hypothetical protein
MTVAVIPKFQKSPPVAPIAWLEIPHAAVITAPGIRRAIGKSGNTLNIRVVSLVCAGALSLIAAEMLLSFGVVAQTATVGMGAASSDAGSVGPVRLAAESLPAVSQDPAERSAKAIECAQKADAQGLQGKPRKHFLRECKRGS